MPSIKASPGCLKDFIMPAIKGIHAIVEVEVYMHL